ncbi:MAG: cytochrome-c oxidase, cbb3-type subunit III [Betaproteobacteria bacterium HGW-Betaproteobacteria-17]|nr:MAG: cytochrome-c oxidase, cbb3-type subunit III [Betaproteobacteria bacterium HGW-Betaproteobacteria-17]
MSEQKLQSQTVQTTGHAWDGDLQEYNNPLPVWWVYTFYATVIFALIYWTIYPSWPLGKGWIGGVSNITYVNSEGETKTHSWNTRALLMADMNQAATAQKPYFDKIQAMSYEQIANDPEMSGFILSAGRSLFAENCAACHQAGGQGVIGFFPNLTDDDWLYGGSYEKIHATLMDGRRGYMPAFGEVLNGEQIDQLANYVASLSGIEHDATKARAGDMLFRSDTAACYYCHTSEATGRQDMGAPNLTDNIWLWADVPAADTAEGKVAAIRGVIAGGLNKGVMPAWSGRLSPEQIKVLTVYVHELGGGQ